MCEATHTSFAKTLSEEISQKAISSSSKRYSMPTPATFLERVFTQDLRPRSHALFCLGYAASSHAVLWLLAVVDPTLPGL